MMDIVLTLLWKGTFKYAKKKRKEVLKDGKMRRQTEKKTFDWIQQKL